MPGFATPLAPAPGSDIIEAILRGRTGGRVADLGAWLLDNSRAINQDIFNHPRLLELSASELALLRAVAPQDVFNIGSKQVFLQIAGVGNTELANALFQRVDSTFLSALIDLGFSNTQITALGRLCREAYQRHLRAPDSIVEGLY